MRMNLRSLLVTMTIGCLGLTAGAFAQSADRDRAGAGDSLRPTTLVTQQPLRASDDGELFLSMGEVLPILEQPVGSCRLRFDRPGRAVAAGTRLRIASVQSSGAGLVDRGISSVTISFVPRSPIRSMFCDTVGGAGPSWGDVAVETRGVLLFESIEPVALLGADR